MTLLANAGPHNAEYTMGALIRMATFTRMRSYGCYGTNKHSRRINQTGEVFRVDLRVGGVDMAASMLQSKTEGAGTYTYSSQPHAAPQRQKYREK